MTPPEPISRRFPKIVTAAAVIITMAFVGTSGAAASGAAASGANAQRAAGGAGSAADLQTQAQELVGQIEANGVRLDQLDESYNAAELQYQQLSSQEAALKKSIARTDLLSAATKRALKEQAILDYITGGAPLVTRVSDSAGSDPNLATSYAEIISGGQQRAISDYQSALALQANQSQRLQSAEDQASVAVADIHDDRAAAAQTVASQSATLAGINGRLAVVVAEVEASQAQAEQASIETSLAQQGQLPPSSPPGVTSGGGGTRSSPGPGTTATTQPAPTDPPTTDSAAPTTTPPRTTPTTVPKSPPTTVPQPPPNQQAPGSQLAIDYARAQLGKPYQWGGAGPNSFDCSGLVMMAWEQADVYFPHLAQDQYDLTRRIPLSDLLPGDLVFYGTPDDVYHVGLYIGGGEMIDAPETGQNVQIQSIYWSGLLGGGRVES
jgi:cell wall-associated NlpC family hydrolase